MKKYKNYLAVFLIFLASLCFRLYGLDWDQSQHLHPDERFLTMVTNDIKLPSTIREYFNTSSSPLNPYNYPSYQFFVYGTFPIFLTKFLAVLLNMDSYDKIYLVGRVLSAIFDSTNIIFLYILSKKYLPSLLYAFCALPLQLSHFYAVDTFLNTSLFATFTFLSLNLYFPAAIAFGFALACKISAIYFAPIIVIFAFYKFYKTKNFKGFILESCILLLVTFLLFRFFQPYSFTGPIKLNPLFVENIKQLKSMSSPDGNFPPSVQWLSKIPLLNSLQNIVLWGAGVSLTILFIFSLIKTNFKKKLLLTLALVWIIALYFYQGSQFAHTMRYFLPIYPFICLLAGSIAFSKKLIFKIFIICHLIFGILFLSIYSRPHTRVQASQWIYHNLPSGSNITNEYWDDPLPLYLPNYSPYVFNGTMLPLYDPDSPEKWQNLNQIFSQTDYIFMSSNRLWGSIPLVPKKYPTTTKFYRDLFSQKLNFQKLIEINSYPGINLPFLKKCVYLGPSNFPGVKNSWLAIDTSCKYPGIFIRDDIAEEAFSVYDHPKVLIFSRH